MDSNQHCTREFQIKNKTQESRSTNQTQITFALVRHVTLPVSRPVQREVKHLTRNIRKVAHDGNSNRSKRIYPTRHLSPQTTPSSFSKKPKQVRSYENQVLDRDMILSNDQRPITSYNIKEREHLECQLKRLPGVCTANKILYYFMSIIRDSKLDNRSTDLNSFPGFDFTDEPQQGLDHSEHETSMVSYPEDGDTCVEVSSDSEPSYVCNTLQTCTKDGTFLVTKNNHKRYITAAELKTAEVDVFDPAYDDDACNNHYGIRQDHVDMNVKLKSRQLFKQRTYKLHGGSPPKETESKPRSSKTSPKYPKGRTFLITNGNHKRYKSAEQLQMADVDVFDPAISEDVCNSHCERFKRKAYQPQHMKLSKKLGRRFTFSGDDAQNVYNDQSEYQGRDEHQTDSERFDDNHMTQHKMDRLLNVVREQTQIARNEDCEYNKMKTLQCEQTDKHDRGCLNEKSLRKSVKFFDPRFKENQNEQNIKGGRQQCRFKRLQSNISSVFNAKIKSSKVHRRNSNLETLIDYYGRDYDDDDDDADDDTEDNNDEHFVGESREEYRSALLGYLGDMIDQLCSSHGEEFLVINKDSNSEASQTRVNNKNMFSS